MDADGLGEGGARLWSDLVDDATPESMRVMVLEAARTVDRLEELDNVIHGKGVLELMRFRVLDVVVDAGSQRIDVTVDFSNVLAEARQQGAALRGLLAEIAKQAAVEPRQSLAATSDLNV